MATNANLPAGFAITTINGARCTIVPKSSTTLTGSLASQAATLSSSSTSAQETQQTSTTAIQNSPQVASSATALPTTAGETNPQTISIAASTTTPPVSATAVPEVQTNPTTTTAITDTDGESTSVETSGSTASKGTIQTGSTAPSAIAESQPSSTATLTPGAKSSDGLQSLAMSLAPQTATAAAPGSSESAAGGGISSAQQLTAAPVIGGVVGSVAFVGIVGLLFWFLRRRKRSQRNSLLTPLTTPGNRSEFDEDDTALGRSFSEKWRRDIGSQKDRLRTAFSGLKTEMLGFGTSLKSKVVGDRSDTPSVNLNRGNSQFIDGPIPQHSRSNSTFSQNIGQVTVKERFLDWWDHFTETIKLRKNNEPADPFAAARGMSEKQANLHNSNTPDFSQLLGMDDRQLQLQAERRRASLGQTQSAASLPPLGSLGLNFDDPFADPVTANKNKAEPNPFADPISASRPSIPKPSTYVADIRRSRGQSVDATNRGVRPPSNVVISRYPSSIPSRDSYRDTVFTSFSANTRKGKGRSDPFDLERPELWQRPPPPAIPRSRGASISGRDSASLYPNPLTMNNLQANQTLPPPRVVSMVGKGRVQSTETYGSKYSSGVSSLGGWGDPGPDLGPGSQSSSLRGNASSNGGSGDFSANSHNEMYAAALREDNRNMSPVSDGVGKAM